MYRYIRFVIQEIEGKFSVSRSSTNMFFTDTFFLLLDDKCVDTV